nr:double-strand break repair protein AddB [uncultured Sphingomonas sp.]
MAEAGLFGRRRLGDPLVYSIPAHRSFADALATGLVRAFKHDPLALASGRILLPNNRAVRTMTAAFVRESGGGLVLPRLIPIGDAELGERLGGALDPLDLDDSVSPAIDPLTRQLMLAKLLRQDGETAAEAMRLAEDLARTMDTLAVEEISTATLSDAVKGDADLAAHWQQSLARFQGVFGKWPTLLAERGVLDLTDRRGRILRSIARRWEHRPPEGFTIAAGITTIAPAIMALLYRVARLDAGFVVLPAVADRRTMPDEEWEALGPDAEGQGEETHPQFHLKRLLEGLSVKRDEVVEWPASGRASSPAVRGRAVAHAMAAANASDKWNDLPAAERRLTGIVTAELPDPAAEAQAIALALREAIETPERTAALVTPDRGLAERVSAHLARWGIEADDSAGTPLSRSPAGTLLLALAAARVEQLSPVAVLALLKHPLVGGEGDERRRWLENVRALDLALRGPRPKAGIDGIDDRVAEAGKKRVKGAPDSWRALRPSVISLAVMAETESLAGLAQWLREAATALTGDRAWRGPDGKMAAELLAQLEDAPESGGLALSADDVIPILRRLMDQQLVRKPYGGHPRIFIWGLLEARLQQADLMILGGMNEGVWPAQISPDPWLAPQIRRTLGLPGLEFRTGLSAHDFMSALGAPRVLITRARRDSRSPTIASRFWLRLQAMTGGVTRDQRLERLAVAIDRADHQPVGKPAPRPPLAARPDRIAVTDIDRLKADPFAFYAKAILKLAKLDAVDAETHAAWKGTAVHDVLEHWFKEDGADPAKLAARAELMLAGDDIHPMLRALWAPRLLEAIDWIAAQTNGNLANGRTPIASEEWGEAKVAGVTLFGKVDRIDELPDGRLAIVDYKTGQPPKNKAVAEGYAMQLGLLSLIARYGKFGGISGDAGAHEYWSLAKDRDSFGFVRSPDKDDGPELFIERAHAQFNEAAAKWLLGEEAFEAKLNPAYAPYEDYDQLMRLEEWYGRD